MTRSSLAVCALIAIAPGGCTRTSAGKDKPAPTTAVTVDHEAFTVTMTGEADARELSVEMACPRGEHTHVVKEIGFRRPDALVILPEDKRDDVDQATDDLVALGGEAFFVRAVLPIPVRGLPPNVTPWNIGLWARVSADDFKRITAAGDKPFDPVKAQLANQHDLWGPTFGLPVELNYTGASLRPTLTVLDKSSALATRQRDGLTLDQFRDFYAGQAHRGDPEPKGAPFRASRATHGYSFVDLEGSGPSGGTVPDELHTGEVIKVAMKVDGTTPMGELRTYTYGVWVLIDDVADPQLIGGTISNEPKLPLTLGFGSRVWVPRTAIDTWTASLPE